MRTASSAAAVALAAALVAGCGSSSSSSSSGTQGTNSSAAAPTTPAKTTTTPPAATPAATGVKASTSRDLTSKPTVPRQTAPAPKTLVVQDIVKGTGPVAKPGETVSVEYVGVLYASGKQFDASWDRGAQPFTFSLGAAQVIPGWDRGVAGMRVGGRRQLTIPPDLGYGAQGTPDGSIPPNAPLIFVVDLRKVGA
jgi:peptidylprolyl isomerase